MSVKGFTAVTPIAPLPNNPITITQAKLTKIWYKNEVLPLFFPDFQIITDFQIIRRRPEEDNQLVDIGGKEYL